MTATALALARAATAHGAQWFTGLSFSSSSLVGCAGLAAGVSVPAGQHLPFGVRDARYPSSARITQPGRAYLQVGNNEVYELFQSAWSGAPYVPDADESAGAVDKRVYLINELGQGSLVNDDLSLVDPAADARLTELDAVIEHIARVHTALGSRPVDKPWLPPLGTSLISPHIATGHDVGAITEIDLTVPLGVLDIPERQAQEEHVHDFLTDGNLAVYGAPASGKSTTLATIGLTLACRNNPGLMQLFVLDYGSAGLATLRGLPHTADYMTIADEERLGKLLDLLTEELARRRDLFTAANVHSHELYNHHATATGQPLLPAWLVIVDNFDVVTEIGSGLPDFFAKLTRDGASAGIWVTVSAARAGSMKYSVISNFRRKITHHQSDSADTSAIVGRTPYSTGETPGRALIRLDETHLAQMYLPAANDGTPLEYTTRLTNLVTALTEANTSTKAAGVQVLPDQIPYTMLAEHFTPGGRTAWIGFDTDTTQPVGFDLRAGRHLIVGRARSGRTNVLRLIAAQYLNTNTQLYVADSPAGDLIAFAGESNVVYNGGSADDLPFLDHLEQTITRLEQAREQAKAAGQSPRQFLAAQPVTLVLIDELDAMQTSEHAKRFAALIERSQPLGIVFIGTVTDKVSPARGALMPLFAGTQNGLITSSSDDGQSLVRIETFKKTKAVAGVAYLKTPDVEYKIKLPAHPNTAQEEELA